MKVEMFFDYSCPFCYKGYKLLDSMLDQYPHIEMEWRTCEAHPLPEVYPTHSHLALQGMYYVKDHGGDLNEYHEAMYRLVFDEQQDFEDSNVLADCAAALSYDRAAFYQALEQGTYEQVQKQSDVYAYEQCSIWAVPSFIAGSRRLDAKPGIGVTREDLQQFLSSL